MSVEDETWDRPICEFCNKEIPYGKKTEHYKGACSKNTKSYQEWRDQVESYSKLERGWDTYDAPPIPEKIIAVTLGYIDFITAFGGQIQYLSPTSDGEIIIAFTVGNVKSSWYVGEENTGIMTEIKGVERKIYGDIGTFTVRPAAL